MSTSVQFRYNFFVCRVNICLFKDLHFLYLLLFPPAGKMSLSGWVCLVTGASRGIGRGIALQLSEAGATVYITGRQERTLKQTAAEVITTA